MDRTKKILLTVLMIFVFATILLGAENRQLTRLVPSIKTEQYQKIEKASNQITESAPCDTRQTYADTNGLQCMALGHQNAWEGIWLHPVQSETKMLTWDSLTESLVASWQTYASQDKTFSFKYPKDWTVQPSGEDFSQGVQILKGNPQDQTVGSGELPGIRILVDKNSDVQKTVKDLADSMQQCVQYSGGKLLTSQVEVQGSLGTRYEVIPATTLQLGSIAIVIPKKNYCIIITADRYGVAEEDFPTELLLSTIKTN